MDTIKRILVPIDFSGYSKNLLDYANHFAKIFNAKVYLITVIEPIIYPIDFSIGQINFPVNDSNLEKKSKKELKKLADFFFDDNIASKLIIKTGKPFIKINETAGQLDIDLIIIATHGHTGVEHLLFGSTAEKVVRKAPCPVLTLREPIKGFKFS